MLLAIHEVAAFECIDVRAHAQILVVTCATHLYATIKRNDVRCILGLTTIQSIE